MKNKLINIFRRSLWLTNLARTFLVSREYFFDCIQFLSYYMSSHTSSTYNQYKIAMLCHSIEKGVSIAPTSLWGLNKAKELLELLNEGVSTSSNFRKKYYYELGVSALHRWYVSQPSTLCLDNSFKRELESFLGEDNLEICGVDRISRESLKELVTGVDYKKFIQSRHSVRAFSSRPLKENEIEFCVETAQLSPSACNRQFCNFYWIRDKNCRDTLISHIKGLSCFDLTNASFFVVTFDLRALSFWGERNQGFFNAGLIAMNFVNALHSKMIGSCFLQWANSHSEEKELRRQLRIKDSEKIAVVIAAGYYQDENLFLKSKRRKREDIFFYR